MKGKGKWKKGGKGWGGKKREKHTKFGNNRRLCLLPDQHFYVLPAVNVWNVGQCLYSMLIQYKKVKD